MAELPEIIILSNQMQERIAGKTIEEAEVLQKKCLNCSLEKFLSSIKGKIIQRVSYSGKWFVIQLNEGYLLINLGMGGDMVYFNSEKLTSSKYQFKFLFDDKTGFTIRFWWFGYVHFVNSLYEHKMTRNLGPSPLHPSFNFEKFKNLLEKKRGNIKSFLLNQKNISGIGNFYIHDILFEAKIHPLRKIESLSEEEINSLYKAIIDRLSLSLKLGGADYELNFLGERGRFGFQHYLIGYKEGEKCPECRSVIKKIRTGGNSSFICPKCQKL